MRSVFLLAMASLYLLPSAFGQDTTTVQTLTFDDITKRRGMYVFPDDSQEFRKILMYYTLKCDAQTTQDQFACGEWDYLSHNFIYDHTGALDSNLITHPSFYVGTETPDIFEYHPYPLYNYYQHYLYSNTISETLSEELSVIGMGASESTALFGSEENLRTRFLYTATELTAAGLTAGDIHRLLFETAAGSNAERSVSITMAATGAEQITGLDNINGSVHFDGVVNLTPSATQYFNLTTPFSWNGTSSIIVEVISEPVGAGGTLSVEADSAPENTVISASGTNGVFSFETGEFLRVPVSGQNFGDEITVSMWTFGNPDVMPSNSYLFEAVDAMGQRALNVHLPWSDGRIYWDAGAGEGHDRIHKQANTADYEGNWNHWAFTKNANTGEMSIFLNGALWHSGTGLSRPIGELHEFNIAKGIFSNNGYDGKIDEFRVWNKALDEATISEWMHREIDASHPNYSDLALYYNFNEQLQVPDLSANGMDALIFGSPDFEQQTSGIAASNMSVESLRPKISFARGEYVSQIDSVMVLDSALQSPVWVVEYTASNNVLTSIEDNYYWPAGCRYWHNPQGAIIDSLCFNTQSTLTNTEVSYYGPAFEVIDRWEIGRFITPYGINLQLPANGFTWVYDVTDYAHLLRDTVDLQMGNQQELIDVRFEMISGTPPSTVLEMNKVWGDMASRSYGDLSNDNVLSAKEIELLPATGGLKLKTRLTGHGHESNSGNFPHCCEWKNNTHYLLVNGSQEKSWNIWQTHDCALNPVYPQGGTWPGAREGWCPGDLVKEHDFMLTDYIAGGSITLDYDITPVPSNNQGMSSGNYVMAMQLFQYSSPNYTLDAEVYNVINPSKAQTLGRHNPICRAPRIVIRNNGSETLTSATITYSVSGGTPLTMNWSGSLKNNESEVVTLSVSDDTFWDGDEEQIFTATISQPNGSSDEYAANDSYYSPFDLPAEYPFDFIVWFKTNNYPQENSYSIKDIEGNVVFERNSLDASTIYRDTMDLAPGCYTFEFLDTGNDGLSYWANPAQGGGYLRFKRNGGSLIEGFQAEFGRSVIRSFTVGDFTSIYDNTYQLASMRVFPNPTGGNLQIELFDFEKEVTLEVYNPTGQVVMSERIAVNGYLKHHIDLSNHPAGIYFVKVHNQNGQLTRKVVVE